MFVRIFPVAIVTLCVAALAVSDAGCNFDQRGAQAELSTTNQALWSGGANIGGTPGSDPAIATWAPGRFDLFYLSSRGTLLHRWFENTWSAEEDLGGNLTSSPAAVSWQSGRIDIFARGTDANGTPNVLMHLWYSSGWRPWESLGGTLTSGPSVASWVAGRLDIFYANASHALGHIWFDGDIWEPHEQLGPETFVGSPAAVSWSRGRIDVVARGSASGSPLIHKWIDGGNWSGWETLGGALSSNPAIASFGQGRLDVFYRGASGALLTQWFDSGAWHTESSLGGTFIGAPGAVSWGGQRIDVVVNDPGGGVVQRTWLPGTTRDVLTQHNDNYRSGAALDELVLTPASVSPESFGELYRLPVSGKVYAQPLYAEHVQTASGFKNLVYVVTLKNNIYAFDADATTPSLVWSRRAGVDFESPTPNDGNANFGNTHDPSIGILATPVISRARNALYVTDSTGSGAAKVFHINALDLGTGADLLAPVAVGGTTTNRSTYVDPASGHTTTFVATFQLNRPGLALADGLVYVAFGGSVDRDPYHGWIFAHSLDTLGQVSTYTTTGATRSGGGIWQSGGGLAVDEHGAIVFMSGNGLPSATAPSAPERQEGSFVKLSPGSLQVLAQYWPHDLSANDIPLVSGDSPGNEFQHMEYHDLDLGSGGPLLVPGKDVIVGGGKTGKLFVLDRGLVQRQTSFQAFVNTWLLSPVQPPPPAPPVQSVQPPYVYNMDTAPNIHGSPVYWETSDPTRSYIYAWAEKDVLKAFPLNRHTLTIDTANVLQAGVPSKVNSMPGGMLSLSAHGTTAGTGIVWAVVEDPIDPTCQISSDEATAGTTNNCSAIVFTVPGYLYAFNAETLAVLYHVKIDRYSKFAPPTIANGKVFVATFNDAVIVYGLHTIPPPPNDCPGQTPVCCDLSNGHCGECLESTQACP